MMSPRVPLAIQQRILEFAIPDERRRPRQQLRRQLSLVCKAWRTVIAFDTDVDVLSMAQLLRLRDRLANAQFEAGPDSASASGEPRRALIRAAYLKLRKVAEEDEAGVAELLATVSDLEELTIEINGGDRSLLKVDGIRNGLCGLRRLKRFAFLGLDPHDPASPAAPLSKHSMQA